MHLSALFARHFQVDHFSREAICGCAFEGGHEEARLHDGGPPRGSIGNAESRPQLSIRLGAETYKSRFLPWQWKGKEL